VTATSTSLTADITTDLIVGAERRPGIGRIPVLNPSNEEEIATVADADVRDGLDAVDAADEAGRQWRQVDPRDRATILMRAWELLTERTETFAELISLENGKALPDARAEVTYAAEFFRWYAEEAVRLNGHIGPAPRGGHKIVVQYEPIGVAILVTPWNFPAAMATRKLAPALAAGCATVLKPATLTPLTAYAIADLLFEAGVPAGVVNVVTTRQSGPVVSAMLHHPRARVLSFTGSTPVGVNLLKEAADGVLKCCMELGGNAAFVVLDDADIAGAVDAAMVAKMRNGGEACTAANRILVQRGVADEFVRAFGERMSGLKIGTATDPQTQLGPLVSASAVNDVRKLVEDATARGARVSAVGESPEGPGYWHPATVLTDVPEGAAILEEEIFGPVAPIITFDTIDEAVRIANATPFGLAAYVYGGDIARAMRVGERLEAGMVGINRGLISDPAAPFGGVKQSGLGREGGREGILEYSEAKYMAVAW
jgi:succinate-semialdehyde dehydrogenase / glutarate-semialdehyde dehydrogenase